MKKLKVLRVIDEYNLVINAGSDDNIKETSRFLIYELGDDLIDEETGENFGPLEIVKGTGKILHLQQKICTVTSSMIVENKPTKKIVRKLGLISPLGGVETEELFPDGTSERRPFLSPSAGDLARLI